MPFGQECYRTDEQKTRLEERNSRLLIDETKRLLGEMNQGLALSPEIIKQLQKTTI